MDTRTLTILKDTTQYLNSQRQGAYLVGGSLRDILLGEVCSDWDIVVEGDAHRLARRLADKLGGYYARLHEKASRVIVKDGTREIALDIAPLNGRSIEEDLLRRDFTINAMGARLDEVVRYVESGEVGEVGGGGRPRGWPLRSWGGDVIDPARGVEDIVGRRLRAVGDDVFRHDALRMLRAVRLMMRYGFDIDEWTRGLIKRDAGLLPGVAAERIHDELYAILEPEGATGRLRLLDELGLLTILIPEFGPARGMRQPVPHYWDVLEHSLETVGALERVANMVVNGSVSENWGEIRNVLYEAEQQGIFSFAGLTAARMKLAALLHDIGKPPTFDLGENGGIHFYNHPQVGAQLVQQIMRRLSASTQDRRLAQLVAAHHMRPGQLAQDATVTPRAIRRYFVDLGPTGIVVALFSLADHLATLGHWPLQPLNEAWERHLSCVRLLLTRYIRERESILPPRLLSPEELMRRLKLEPGPVVGQLLEVIAEAQAEGLIHSKEEALWLAEERLGAS